MFFKISTQENVEVEETPFFLFLFTYFGTLHILICFDITHVSMFVSGICKYQPHMRHCHHLRRFYMNLPLVDTNFIYLNYTNQLFKILLTTCILSYAGVDQVSCKKKYFSGTFRNYYHIILFFIFSMVFSHNHSQDSAYAEDMT